MTEFSAGRGIVELPLAVLLFALDLLLLFDLALLGLLQVMPSLARERADPDDTAGIRVVDCLRRVLLKRTLSLECGGKCRCQCLNASNDSVASRWLASLRLLWP